jgi:SMI1 / KNR4 family (SUKH-1)
MTEINNQLLRIKGKILIAKDSDKNFRVFGAERHKYIIHEPTTLDKIIEIENKYSIELPECYKSFLLNIGNGGIGWQNSSAGPFFGIYPLGENLNELIFNNPEKYLKNKCVLYPKMTDEYWKILIKNIEDDDKILDEQFEKELSNLWSGILPIGSQGCSYLHGIILNGQYRGRVVNLDIDRQKPNFAFEDNFLDWYERWLDEVISGELIKESPSWFGYNKGGSEQELLDSYKSLKDSEERSDDLFGLLNKSKLNDNTLNQIVELIKNNFEPKNILIQLICKSNYEKAKPLVTELIKTDLLSVFKFVFLYAKNKSNEWLIEIENNINRIDDEETFRYCTYLLKETETNYGNLIIPFIKHSKENIRTQAFYSLGQLKNKSSFIDTFIEGLYDTSNTVIHSTLQALSGIKENKLLEHYRILAEKFPNEKDYILANLNHRLAEYGLTNLTILKERIEIKQNLKDENTKKKWYEIWK